MSHDASHTPPAEALRTAPGLTVEVVTPDHPDYDQHRAVWNGLIDRHPALIARCVTAEDVAACVRVARAHQLPIAVRCGAHSVAGHGTVDGGLVIDLSPMKDISVDAEARTAVTGGGVTWGELDAATQEFGLATPGGVFSRTGIGGLTLGGGYGWLRNPFGLSCDNLVGAELVTASGKIVQASDAENAELLWGLRGGGGNFGVVTQFTFRLHEVGPDVMFVFAFFDGEPDAMRAALRFYRDFCADHPETISTIGFAGVFPPGADAYPEDVHGKPFFGIGALHAGPPDEGRVALQPILDFAAPLVDFSGVMPYVDAQRMFDEDYPDGWRYYWKSTNLRSLDDDAIDVIVEHARQQPSAHSTIDVWHVGGAVAALPDDATAFHGRRAAFLVNPEANWEHATDDAANITWARETVAALEPFSDGSRYLNFAGLQEEGEPGIKAAFGDTYERLRTLKREWDPDNLFRLNQNVVP
ncbi:MAG: FAD-binding oxidoreductase [Actinomycetes bacterium]